jgi:hypothetical protein
MIEYTLISIILNKICEMTKKIVRISKRWYQTRPPLAFARNKTWGTKWKRVIDKTDEWVAWRWANAKIDRQRKHFIIQTNSKHFQGKYGRLQYGNVYTCHEFLPRMRKFEMVNSKTHFHKLIERFVDRRVGNPWELAINKIHETQNTTLCNSR